jgi:RNA polymerase sigma-70 factor (ECF subfamily)
MPESEHPSAPDTETVSASDHSLLERFRAGEENAAALLYQRYAARLRGLVQAQLSSNLARRVEAEDVVQSVFRTFFRHAHSGSYDIPGGEELWNLFLVIALNKIRNQWDYHTAAKRDVRLEIAASDVRVTLDQLTRDDSAAQSFLHMVVNEALERLPPHHRRVVQLRLEGRDVAEIAQTIQRARRTTERILQELRFRLADLLELEA